MAPPPRRVLIIDSDPATGQSLEQLVSHEGHHVTRVEDGPAAVAKMDEWAPDVVLLDLTLPLVALFGVSRRVRAFDPSPPVLGLSHRDAGRPSADLGLSGCLFKPFHTGAVRAAVRRALGVRVPAAAQTSPTRAHRRLSVALDTVVLTGDGKPIARGKIVNLSVGGAQPHLDTRLEVGERVFLDFRLPGYIPALTLPARIQWRNPATSGFAFGVVFEEVTPDVGRALKQVVESVR